MRILMVTPMLPYAEAPSAGPLSMYGILSTLRSRHEVTLATFAGPEPAERVAIERLRETGLDIHVVWRPEPSGIRRWTRRWRLLRGWLRATQPLRALEFVVPEMQRLLDRLGDERAFDLIQVEDNAMASYRYPSDIPRVLTEHEVRVPSPAGDTGQGLARISRGVLRTAEWRRWRAYQRAVWRRFDRIQVFTPRDAHAVHIIAPEVTDRVRVNPFGVCVPAEPDLSREEAESVVFVGGFVHRPNVDAALWLGYEILPLLRTRRPGIRLFIVGDQPPEAVRALAGDDIVVTGRVPAVEPFLERAAVVLAPVRLGGGMRMKVLQAMALGKAVVTTPLGAEGLAPGSGSIPLQIGHDAVELADATLELLAAPEARLALGRRARAFVAEHLSWMSYGRRLEAIYAELQGQGRTEQWPS